MAHLHAALAPRTWWNRERHATLFVGHMHERGLNHLAPTAYVVAQYTASLHHALPSPASVANALSGARAWRREVGMSNAAFTAPWWSW